MKIVSYPEADAPAHLRVQVVALQEQAWPSGQPVSPAPSHDPALLPLSVLLVDDGHVLAALDILSKEITHDGQRFSAGGLSTVVTDQLYRGKGYGRQLVEAGRRLIAASGADLGIFTCDRNLQAFYERAGWTHLPGTVLIGGTPDATFPSDQFDKVTMVSFFSTHAKAFAESFVGRRVELYPGPVDKLW